MDNFLNDISRYKKMTNFKWFKNNRLWFTNVGKSLWKILTTPIVIVLIVVGFVYLA